MKKPIVKPAQPKPQKVVTHVGARPTDRNGKKSK
jgi:hypothetical protein